MQVAFELDVFEDTRTHVLLDPLGGWLFQCVNTVHKCCVSVRFCCVQVAVELDVSDDTRGIYETPKWDPKKGSAVDRVGIGFQMAVPVTAVQLTC